jgi:hypothetical protein
MKMDRDIVDRIIELKFLEQSYRLLLDPLAVAGLRAQKVEKENYP